jgi:Carboxypeptidase regulatory-like domain/TonB dependent receptor-like, beta-barrel
VETTRQPGEGDEEDFAMLSVRHLCGPFKLLRVVSIALCCAAGLTAAGQGITGAINGTVTDPSGAVVVGAKVTAINVETGVSVSTVTNSAGMYNIGFLQIGKYQVRAEKPGFETQVFPAFTLEQGSIVKVDCKLAVGTTSTVVQVQGALEPLLDTEDAMTTTTLDSTAIENITNNGRNFSLFTALVPGAVDTFPQQLSGNFAVERDGNQTSEIGVNGNRAQGNNYVLDGVEINETVTNLIGYNPNLDALSEVKVISGNPDAEYGNEVGMTVLAATKSGTNQFHGSAGMYIENYNMDANSWANKNHVPGQVIPKNPFEQNIWSGAIGGPVLLPHLFNGRNKLFFFADYEGTRLFTAGHGESSVLSSKMRTGDFSELLDPVIMCGGTCTSQSKLIQLYDPANNFAPYPNNQIPVNNPVVQFLVAHPSLYPLPNTTPTGDSPISNNYTGSQKSSRRNDQGDLKIDWTPTDKDRASFRYTQGEASDFELNPLLVQFPTPGDYPVKGFAVDYTHTFSPKLVNEFQCCFFRTRYTNAFPLDLTGLFGTKGNSVVGIPGGQTVPGFSQNNFPDGGVSAVGSSGGGSDEVNNIFNYADNLSYQEGRHMFKMGVQFERYQQNYFNSSDGLLGSFGFTGVYTSNPSVGAGNATTPSAPGYGTADWVLDEAQNEAYGTAQRLGQRQWRDAYYFQDDWRILPKLTLYLGVRYQYDQPVYEVNNKENNPRALYDGQGGYVIQTAGKSGASRALYNPTYHDILPRFGIDYQLRPGMVLSIGYGDVSFMEGGESGDRLTQNAPFQYNFSLTGIPPGTNTAGQFFKVTDGFSSTNPTYSGKQYFSFNPHLQPEVVQNYNVSLQFELGSTRMLKVGYVGQKGYHLIEEYRGNQLVNACQVNGVIEPYNYNSGGNNCAVIDPTPFAQLVGQGGNVITTDSEAIMEYDGMQVQFRQTVWNGLDFTANYALAKAFTDATGFQAVADVNGTGVAPENSYNVPLNWGLAGQSEKSTFNANAVYQLPFGRGRLLFSNVNRAVDEAINGWKLSGVVMAYTGFPNTVGASSQGTQTYYNGAPQQRPMKLGTLPKFPRYKSGGDIWWWGNQTAATIGQAYGPVPNGAFGNTKVGDLRGPGYVSYDASLFKNFTIFREETLGFELDAYNLLNHVNWQNPGTGSGSPTTFGKISGVRGQERYLQIAAKYTF